MPLTNKQKLGQISERFARMHLESSGYLIQERNWRFSRAEIDIIAKWMGCIIFVEVKSTQNQLFVEPELHIHSKKKNILFDASFQYLNQINHTLEFRYDIISVVLNADFELVQLNHYEDAFFPGLK